MGAGLLKIPGKLAADRFRQYRHMPVLLVPNAQYHLHTLLPELHDLSRRQGEVEEMDARGLSGLAGAFDIPFRFGDGRLTGELQADRVLDAAQPVQQSGPPDRVVDLEHQGCDQFFALGDQRVVGEEFAGDLLLPPFSMRSISWIWSHMVS